MEDFHLNRKITVFFLFSQVLLSPFRNFHTFLGSDHQIQDKSTKGHNDKKKLCALCAFV